MFPIAASFAEAEHVVFFHAVHLIHDRMTDLRLQFADKIMEHAHFDNRHESCPFQNPALAGSRIEGLVENVKASVRPCLAFKMVSSQFAPPSAGWLGVRWC